MIDVRVDEIAKKLSHQISELTISSLPMLVSIASNIPRSFLISTYFQDGISFVKISPEIYRVGQYITLII